ncbi:hypothetical protein [Streptomyces xiaopingdaonensis]|uniref:hypothetical protein n=1 Tax=Streptomyces xiaopingdaonensis TaxID=1565415 RepID=UPI00030AEC08|nr:hypothetical protein [Streptomyces xiaopingdaonensis]
MTGHPHPGPLPPEGGPQGAVTVPQAPDTTSNAAPPQPRSGGRHVAPRTPGAPGSPLIAPGIASALCTAGLAALLAAGAQPGLPALAVAVVLLQAVTAAGWYRLNGMWPARQGIALVFLSALVADGGLLLAGAERAPLVILGTLGVWLLLALAARLRDRSGPDERLYALTADCTATVVTLLVSGYLLAPRDAVVVTVIAVAGTAVVRAVVPGIAGVPVALLAGAAAGWGIGELTGMGALGAALGLAVGIAALLGLRVASYDFPSRFVHMTAGVALPLAFAAPVAHFLGSVLG